MRLDCRRRKVRYLHAGCTEMGDRERDREKMRKRERDRETEKQRNGERG